MGPPLYMWSVFDRNVVMQRMTVCLRDIEACKCSGFHSSCVLDDCVLGFYTI